MSRKIETVLVVCLTLLLSLLGATGALAESYQVDSVADNTTSDGLITLREAVQAASTNAAVGDAPAGDPGNDDVTFSPLLVGSTITLISGPLVVTDDLTIDGISPGNPAVSGGGASAVFDLDAGTLDISNLDVREGASVNGGCIQVAAGATLLMDDSFVRECLATVNGGGIYSQGSVTLDTTRVADNEAQGAALTEGGGGLYNDGGSVTLTDSLITDNNLFMGAGSGGGIFNNTGGTLDLTNSDVRFNLARGVGGGIEDHAGASVTLTDSGIYGNSAGAAPGNGAGLHITGAGTVVLTRTVIRRNDSFSEGGGIWVSSAGTLTVQPGSVIDSNVSFEGGGIYNDGGVVTVDGSIIRFNLVAPPAVNGRGGGVFNNAGGRLTVTDSTISGNTAQASGGGVEDNAGASVSLTDVIVSDNVAEGSPGNGGGLHVSGAGTVTLDTSDVLMNSAVGEGGGLWNSTTGSLTVTATTVDSNTAAVGAGLHQDGNGGTLFTRRSTFSNNVADSDGGGLHLEGGSVDLANSTVSGNTATAGVGGGLAVSGGTVSLTNDTVVENAAGTSGGGLDVTGGEVILANTIVADNTAPVGPDVNGPVTSAGYNLIENTSGATIGGDTTGNLTGEDPLLGPLADNGGETLTHLPQADSPVIDAASGLLATAAGLTTDQRGEPRTVDFPEINNAADGTDVGSVEVQAAEIDVMRIPTLEGWMLLLFGMLLGTVALRFLRP